MQKLVEYFKQIILQAIAVLCPYFAEFMVKIALSLLAKSFLAVLTKNEAEIQKAKTEIKANYKEFINESFAEAQKTTTSKVDDVIFGILAKIELDDAFIAKLFDYAAQAEQKFFRTA